MGYTTKDIARIIEPKDVTLASLPNFFQIDRHYRDRIFQELSISVWLMPDGAGSTITFSDNNGLQHTYYGRTNRNEVDRTSFFISSNPTQSGSRAETAENLRQLLLSESWIADFYDITIPFIPSGAEMLNGNKIYIKSKGAGNDYNVIQSVSTSNPSGFTIEWINSISLNNDSISGENSTSEIAVDVYSDIPARLGVYADPTTPEALGRYLTTLRKTYSGSPIWFDANMLFARSQQFNIPRIDDAWTSSWFDAGTARGYRIVARIEDVNSFVFYVSDVLYAITGFSRLSDSPNMDDYTLYTYPVRLLTNRPKTYYIRGQREYLNFILRKIQTLDHTFRVAYKAYTQSNKYIGTIYAHQVSDVDMFTVNTIPLDIDSVLEQYPNAGIIRIGIERSSAGTDFVSFSNYLEYAILPECLHTLRQFTFLNQLGGWDSFNFDASIKDEIKPSNETYKKNITPYHRRGDGIETVYTTSLENTFTIEGAPVSDDIANWLKELAASRVILDNEGNYVIIEDFTLVVTDATKNMQKPIIKYRLSETYTNE